MWLIDQLVEQHVINAQKAGEFDNLPGVGKRISLDDDSQIPEELRASYRLLKNAGYVPPELESRREALQLQQLISSLEIESDQFRQQSKQLSLLKLKLQQAGLSTDFLEGDYADRIQCRFEKQKDV